jgi:hypothetical protein
VLAKVQGTTYERVVLIHNAGSLGPLAKARDLADHSQVAIT